MNKIPIILTLSFLLIMSIFIKESGITKEAGYVMVFNTARAKLPFIEGKIIKRTIAEEI